MASPINPLLQAGKPLPAGQTSPSQLPMWMSQFGPFQSPGAGFNPFLSGLFQSPGASRIAPPQRTMLSAGMTPVMPPARPAVAPGPGFSSPLEGGGAMGALAGLNYGGGGLMGLTGALSLYNAQKSRMEWPQTQTV